MGKTFCLIGILSPLQSRDDMMKLRGYRELDEDIILYLPIDKEHEEQSLVRQKQLGSGSSLKGD